MISMTSSAKGAKLVGHLWRDRVEVADFVCDSRGFRRGKWLVEAGAAAEEALRILAPVPTRCRQRLGLLGDFGGRRKSKSPRDRRGIAQEPGFDARMGHADHGRILRGFEIATALQLYQDTRVNPFGVEDIDETG